MALSLYTAPTVEPITLAEAKAHLRVDIADENDLVTSLIVAARQYCESHTHRAFITQTWDLALDDFPCDFASLELPKAPLVSVSSVTYVDTNGTPQTWSSANYSVYAPSGPLAGPGKIIPAYQVSYPLVRDSENAVTIRFVAGYGAATSVPDQIKAAMKLLIGHWFANRESVVANAHLMAAVPQGVDALLWPFKVF